MDYDYTLNTVTGVSINRLETTVTHIKSAVYTAEVKELIKDSEEINMDSVYTPMILDHVPAKFLQDDTENPLFKSSTWIIQAPDSNGEMRDWYKHADGYSQDRPDA